MLEYCTFEKFDSLNLELIYYIASNSLQIFFILIRKVVFLKIFFFGFSLQNFMINSLFWFRLFLSIFLIHISNISYLFI